MHILLETIPVYRSNRERSVTYVPKLHAQHEPVPRSWVHAKRLYSVPAAFMSYLLQPQNDPFQKILTGD
jgi:hypothetical protein